MSEWSKCDCVIQKYYKIKYVNKSFPWKWKEYASFEEKYILFFERQKELRIKCYALNILKRNFHLLIIRKCFNSLTRRVCKVVHSNFLSKFCCLKVLSRYEKSGLKFELICINTKKF